MSRNCAFCKVALGVESADIVFENDYCVVILDKMPIAQGQLLLIPKKHHFSFRTMEDQEMVEIVKTADRAGAAIIRVLDVDGYNIIYSLGACAGQILNHLSIQIIPRNGNDDIIMPWNKSRQWTSDEEKNLVVEKFRKRFNNTEVQEELDFLNQENEEVSEK